MRNGFFISLLILSASLNAQNSIIRETVRPVTTYPYSDPDPVAAPGRVYPYFRYDGFTNKSETRNWKMVELENDFIRLAVTPEIGGKVWEAYEKSEQYPFVFTTKSIKFRDISLRGPWTTGGLEFNFGDIGHATTCFAPVDYFTRTNDDGSVSCFIGATEWASRTVWRVEIKLEPDKAYFTTRSWWYNNTPVEQEFYHWINAGFKAEGDLEFVFPGTHHLGHGGEYDTWPVDSAGRNINFYKKNNFGSYKSYHIFGRTSDFYGGFWHDDNMGFGRVSPYYEKFGKKVWILGLSQEGERWENLLGDNDGLNVELQSGRLFNQAASESMFTPFKHVGFGPYSADTWTDHWFPVKHTRGLTNATEMGAVNLRIEDSWLKIDWMSLEIQKDTLYVIASGKNLLNKPLSLRPLEVYRDSIKWNGDISNVIVKVGNDVVTSRYKEPVNRPVEAPKNFDWNSEYGLWLRGSDLSKQKSYSEAETYYLKALSKNPGMVPALVQMAQLRYRQGSYEESGKFAKQALAVNTYDPEANFLWGLASEKLGNNQDAFDGYSVSALSPLTRQAAWYRLACLAIKKSDWNEAEKLISRCTGDYPQNEFAADILALIYRKQGKNGAALALLEQQLQIDPINHPARFEKYLITQTDMDRNDFTGLIRQELPHETYIEMALMYYDLGLVNEALQILENAPVHPMVQLLQAYIFENQGDSRKSDEKLTSAMKASPELIFPFRTEMTGVFSWADQQKPSWKWKYYEGLIRWQNNQNEVAKSLFKSCGDEPDFVPFYLAKAELYEDETEVVRLSLEKAYSMNPSDWRSALELARFYNKEKMPEKALSVAEKNYNSHRGSFIIGLHYAQMLKVNRQFTKTLDILSKLEMLPAEGDVNAHTLFRETSILLALEQMKQKQWKKALVSLGKAETWPENLFSGQPYLADNRVTRFMSAYCHERLKEAAFKDQSFDYVLKYANPDGWTSAMGNELTEVVKTGERDYKAIADTVLKNTDGDRDKERMAEFMSIL